MSVDLVIGSDVGSSATRRSNGVVVVDRKTKNVAQGSSPLVDTLRTLKNRLSPPVFFSIAATCPACIRAPALPSDGEWCVSPESLDKLRRSWQPGARMRAEVELKNEMSDAFQLRAVTLTVDGQTVYVRQERSGALAGQRDIRMAPAPLPVGDHVVCIELGYQGNGYGAFEYLRGYRFDLRSAHRTAVTRGTDLTLTVNVWEKGGRETPLERRPTLSWHESVEPASDEKPVAPDAAPP